MLPSNVSTNFRESAVHNLYANVNMSTVDLIFLPMHLHGNHWGLLVFDVRDCSIEYDEGFHNPITASIQQLVNTTLKTISETTAPWKFDVLKTSIFAL